MKTIFTLLSSLFMSIAVFAVPAPNAARVKSMLTVQSAGNSDIRVVVDGRRFEPNDNSLVISGLEAGTHTLKIYREKNSGVFNILGKRYEMVYNTSLLIRAKTHVTVTVDRYGRTSITEQKIRRNGGRDSRWENEDDHYYDYENGKYGDYDDNYGYGRGMDDREFRRVLESIDREWLESNKLKSATHIVTTNTLTAAQVKQMVLMFSFEGNKVELAKQAYRNTVDKRNYYIINDAFSFNSSKDELARFIRNFR